MAHGGLDEGRDHLHHVGRGVAGPGQLVREALQLGKVLAGEARVEEALERRLGDHLHDEVQAAHHALDLCPQGEVHRVHHADDQATPLPPQRNDLVAADGLLAQGAEHVRRGVDGVDLAHGEAQLVAELGLQGRLVEHAQLHEHLTEATPVHLLVVEGLGELVLVDQTGLDELLTEALALARAL